MVVKPFLWFWIDSNCPIGMTSSNCYNCYLLPMCAVDETSCYVTYDGDGFSCPYNMCRQPMLRGISESICVYTMIALTLMIIADLAMILLIYLIYLITGNVKKQVYDKSIPFSVRKKPQPQPQITNGRQSLVVATVVASEGIIEGDYELQNKDETNAMMQNLYLQQDLVNNTPVSDQQQQLQQLQRFIKQQQQRDTGAMTSAEIKSKSLTLPAMEISPSRANMTKSHTVHEGRPTENDEQLQLALFLSENEYKQKTMETETALEKCTSRDNDNVEVGSDKIMDANNSKKKNRMRVRRSKEKGSV